MGEIRKAMIELVAEYWPMGSREKIEAVVDKKLALLPIEGETHLEVQMRQIVEAHERGKRAGMAGEAVEYPEPAPSSEKALREAVDAWGCQHDHPDIMREIDDLLSSPAVAQDKSAQTGELAPRNMVLAQTRGGNWKWMTTDEAMPNPAGGYWIEKPESERSATT